jgi:FAD/FMN-containing dehydrogenase
MKSELGLTGRTSSGKGAYQSWGRYPQARASCVSKPEWVDEVAGTLLKPESSLAYGLGRSYGDVCLNHRGHVVDMSGLNRIICFDARGGRVHCESGVNFADLLDVIVPKGWFLPVTPGTKFVTVGGAIANDVHGKNHHCTGTFGCHVESLELLRSDGRVLQCSREQNGDLFSATVGGLGLTGIVLSASFRLRPISSAFVEVETLPFHGLAEFLALSEESDNGGFEYTVAWADCQARTPRGIFFRGNHAREDAFDKPKVGRQWGKVPFPLPEFVLNPWMLKCLNAAYFRVQARRKGIARVHFNPFFYPLDSLGHWNLLYGRRGFLQYQCVVPKENAGALDHILRRTAERHEGSFLSVIKVFGSQKSPGLLSFPRAGITLTLDFPFCEETTLQLFETFDRIVLDAGGALYPAKDARMSPAVFRASYKGIDRFCRHLDPKLSSNFWRRVGPS